MDEILSMQLQEMAGRRFQCSCGREHTVNVRHIFIGSGCLGKAVDIASEYKAGKLFVVCDENTYEVCGKTLQELFRRAGLRTCGFKFATRHLIPDEKAIGRLLVEMDPETSLIVAAGSGTINDISRMVSFKTHLPYMVVCTAPSMDGYASTVSPLFIDGFKTTFPAVAPAAIVADTSIMKEAPMDMIRAGFGDILGKYTALTDWILSREKYDEYYCATSVKIMEDAVKKCMDSRESVQSRDEKAIGNIVSGLILSGVAMGLVGNSRPASGAEHHMAHYWEMKLLAKGLPHPLHGNAVGVAAAVSACLYELMADRVPAACRPPKPEKITEMLRSVGSCTDPASLGISRELFHESLLHAWEIRERFTILRYAHDAGVLDEYARLLTGRFYGN